MAFLLAGAPGELTSARFPVYDRSLRLPLAPGELTSARFPVYDRSLRLAHVPGEYLAQPSSVFRLKRSMTLRFFQYVQPSLSLVRKTRVPSIVPPNPTVGVLWPPRRR